MNASGTDLSGNWRIQLSYSQSALGGGPSPDGNTVLEVPLTQVAKGSSVLSSSGQSYGDDIGCNANGGGATWWAGGGFNPWVFFQTGQVQNNTIGLSLLVSQSATPSSSQAHGLLTFTGTVNSDGTMSGSVTDGCVISNNQPMSGTWTAKRISTIP